MNTRKPALTFMLWGGLAALTASGCGDVSDNRPATWGYISPAIIQPNCATSSCHSAGAAVAGLDLSTIKDGYDGLRNLKVRYGAKDGNKDTFDRPLVTPFHPESSRVVNMMWGKEALRMPPDRPMPAADIELVARWILDGAENN